MENFKLTVKTIVIGISVTLFTLSFIFFLANYDLFITHFFAPKYEEVRRQTYEESRAFNEGMLRDLQDLMIQYNQAETEEQKQVYLNIVRHRFAHYNPNKLPLHLRGFFLKAVQYR